MPSFNKVLLMGNLTRDPQTRFTTGGSGLCQFGMAINRRYTTAAGEDREDTCFVDIVVFGRQGDWTMENCSKGSPVLIEGRLSFNTWEAKDGTRRRKHEVVAFNVHFLSRRDEGGQGGGTPQGQQAAQESGASWSEQPAGDSPPMTDDDIPF